MNSIAKGLFCLLKGLGLTMLFGFVLESVVNDKTYYLLLIMGLFMLFVINYLENEVKQSE